MHTTFPLTSVSIKITINKFIRGLGVASTSIPFYSVPDVEGAQKQSSTAQLDHHQQRHRQQPMDGGASPTTAAVPWGSF